MKIFIIGMPGSGRTTVAKSLGQNQEVDLLYVDSVSWVKGTFRDQRSGEHPDQYHDAYHQWFTSRMRVDPTIGTHNVHKTILAHQYIPSFTEPAAYIIDGVVSPKDFTELFDYNTDMVVFLNRTDNDTLHKDYESIGVSVIRDYCFWLSSADLLTKERWLEYNFKLIGEGDQVKSLGSKNSVFVVKSLNRAIEHMKSIMASHLVNEHGD